MATTVLTLLHSEQPKLYRVLAVLSAIALKSRLIRLYTVSVLGLKFSIQLEFYVLKFRYQFFFLLFLSFKDKRHTYQCGTLHHSNTLQMFSARELFATQCQSSYRCWYKHGGCVDTSLSRWNFWRDNTSALKQKNC